MIAYHQKEDRDFYTKFLLTFIAHILVFALGYFLDLSFLFNDDLNDLEIKELKSAVRVDVVGMPKHTFKELKELEKAEAIKGEQTVKEKTEPSKEVPIKEGDVVVEKVDKVDLSKLLGNYGGKNIRAKDKAKNNKPKVKNLKSLILEGNKISKGSSIVGDNSGEVQTKFASYVQSLPDMVRAFWKLPSYLKEQELNCRIRIFVDEDGRVIKKVVTESSGSDEYDRKALSAIEKASPFPKPDPKILSKLVRGDVYLGFPL